MIRSRAHRLGEPVLVALGSALAPEGDLYEGGTLLVAPDLRAGPYVMMDARTGDAVGVLELPEEIANGAAWRAVAGEPIDATRAEEGGDREPDEA